MSDLSQSVQISFRLVGDDLARLRAFADREGMRSVHLAARALILGAIDDYPKWGVYRGAIETWLNVTRDRFMKKILHASNEMKLEVALEMETDRSAEATIEKGQVTFSREDQE